MEERFRRHEKLRRLLREVVAIDDDEHGRILKARGITKHDEAREEQHEDGLAAPRRAEVRAAFAIACRPQRPPDARKHPVRAEELRIAADHGLRFRAIGIKDEIAQDSEQAVFRKRALNHGEERGNTIRDGIVLIRFVPCVVIDVRREKRAELRVRPVAEHGKRRVFHELRDVALVAHVHLPPSIGERRVLADGGFELADDERDAIDEEQRIRPPLRLAIAYGELVHDTEAIALDVVEIEKRDMDIRCARIVPRKVKALRHHAEHGAVRLVKR